MNTRIMAVALSTLSLAGCGLFSEPQSACETALYKVFECRDEVIRYTTEEAARVSELIKTVCELVEENVSCDVNPPIDCAADNFTCDESFPTDELLLRLTIIFTVVSAFEGCPDLPEECEGDVEQLGEDPAVEELLALL